MSVDQVIVERARAGEAFETLATIPASDTGYEDGLAIFGIFQYRLKVENIQGTHYSSIVAAETYLGKHFTRLHQPEGGKRRDPIKIVFVHMNKTEKVTVMLYKTDAEMVGEPFEHTLDNNLLEMEIDTFSKGEYVCVVKAEKWPMSIFRFDVK